MSTEKQGQTKAEREAKRRQEELKDRRSIALYTAVGVAVVVAAIVLMIGNSGILQRNLTAQTIGGTKYTAVDVQYFYNNAYSNQAQRYAFDTSKSVKDQVYDQETGQSWYDYLLETAIDTMKDQTALAAQAKSEGYTLSEEARSQMNSNLASLESAWINYGYASRDAFIRANFGAHMTYDRLKNLVEMEYLANDYATSKLDAIEHPDADYEAYYQEHTDELDTIIYTQFAFQAMVPSTDAEGNEVQLTEEEKSAKLEELKAEQKALAEEIKAKLEAGEDPEDLAEEYQDQLYSSAVSRRSTGTNASYSTYGDWLLDSARKVGDITLTERDSDTAYYYYVAVYEGRERDEEKTHDVRHLLVRAGSAVGTETPTQAEYDEAEKKAKELLAEWEAGEATEERFISLISAHSDDTGSAQSGGLISDITSTSSYVEAFRDWAVDPARKEGDVELVKTEYGWHIMYYVSTNDPIWRQNVAIALSNEDYEQLTAGAAQGWTTSEGMGMKFVKS